MKRAAIVTICTLVSACGGGSQLGSSGVMTLGPDTYRIVASRGTLMGGNMGAQRQALDDGAAFCAQKNKQFLAIGTTHDQSVGPSAVGLFVDLGGGFQLDFRCLNSSDPGLGRPTPTQAPSIVIEDRRAR